MCGRYVQVTPLEQLAATFGVDAVRTEPLPARYNVAPSQEVYAVVAREGARRLGTLRWGFIPHWTPTLRGARTPINARLETVATSKMFAEAFRRRRCLLPADGFYEWQAPATDGDAKRPHHLHAPDAAPFAFGGIWTAWRDPEALAAANGDRNAVEAMFSTAIVTRAAEGPLTAIHHRVPLIVPHDRWDEWLTATDDEAPHLAAEMAALPPPDLVADPISTRVNDVRNEGRELLLAP